MRKATAALMATLVMLSGCDETVEDTNEVPVAKYPFTPPPLDENPPMSADQIDQINEQVMKQQKSE